MFLSIKNNSIFVADSHYSDNNEQFLTFLENIINKKVETSQLFFMGDMFDFISGESKYFVLKNKKLIDIINELSNTIEIVYLEGNHDYNMQKLFPKVKVYKREQQPVFAKYNDKNVALSHGDNFINWKYDLYCSIIRNTYLLKFLNFIDINYFISKKIEEALLKKNICHKMTNYENIVKRRMKSYTSDIVIEGHYHQGESFVINNKKYVNIPSLCCSFKYLRFNNSNFQSETI
jgi:UDP-2,3-diacylglucosamine hydrolase